MDFLTKDGVILDILFELLCKKYKIIAATPENTEITNQTTQWELTIPNLLDLLSETTVLVNNLICSSKFMLQLLD